MAFNLAMAKYAQMGMDMGMDLGMPPESAPADPMGMNPMPEQSADAAGGAPYTLGSLIEYINSNPEQAMQDLKQKVSDTQVPYNDVSGQPTNTDVSNLLDPENWKTADEATKGQVAGLIYKGLPAEMKADESMDNSENEMVQAPLQNVKASVEASNQFIKQLAAKLASSSKPKVFNKLAQSMQPINTTIMYGPDTVTNDPQYGYDISRWHVLERNKGFGMRPVHFFSQIGVDYEAFWRTHIMDKFYREYRDEDGNWVGGYLNKRFEVDRNVPETNNMQYKPGEMRKPDRAVLTEGQMEQARGNKPFNWLEAKTEALIKVAGKKCNKCGIAFFKTIESDMCPACCKQQADDDKREDALKKK